MLKLYHYPSSPYGWIARMALAEKGLAYESVHPYDRKENPELSGHNPLNRTPTLLVDEQAVFESWAIMEFLEERFPQPSLLPGDAFARARARALTAIAYMDLLPEAGKVGRAVLDYAKWDAKAGGPPPLKPEAEVDAKLRDEGMAGVTRVLTNVESFARRGEWLAGAFSMADIAFTPFVTNLTLRGYTIPPELPAVKAWLERVRARPSCRAAKPPFVP